LVEQSREIECAKSGLGRDNVNLNEIGWRSEWSKSEGSEDGQATDISESEIKNSTIPTI
jgi:hypothetical protein